MSDLKKAADGQPQTKMSTDGRGRHDVLDRELWTRRQNRLDKARVGALPADAVQLVPLVLALARLAAQRDAKLLPQVNDLAGAA